MKVGIELDTCNRGRGVLEFLLNVTNWCFDLLTVFAEPALHQRLSDAGRVAALFLLHQDDPDRILTGSHLDAEIGIKCVWCMDIELILSQ